MGVNGVDEGWIGSGSDWTVDPLVGRPSKDRSSTSHSSSESSSDASSQPPHSSSISKTCSISEDVPTSPSNKAESSKKFVWSIELYFGSKINGADKRTEVVQTLRDDKSHLLQTAHHAFVERRILYDLSLIKPEPPILKRQL